MIALPGITIFTLIYETTHSRVYRGRRNSDNQPVILKVLKDDYPTSAELTRYKQEYEIASSLNLEGVIKAYGLENFQNTLVIIFEDFGGYSLNLLIQSQKFTILEFLSIAIKTTTSLGRIHASNIIHKDINPSNIVLNPDTGQLSIIDFGISTVLTREKTALKNPKVLEGTLAYISPEQTGRMNRSLDYRTDFYSLGATFYELLTHQLPFNTDDAMELVHCHIAKQPVPPDQLNPKIPKAVSDIVMKLLAKTAEERYQSAWGIQADLEECLHQLQTNGNIEPFPFARFDISDKFQIPQKLYGRQREIETLLAAFERVSGEGQEDTEMGRHEDTGTDGFPTFPHPHVLTSSSQSKIKNSTSKIEMMLVSGYSGIGKSSLVQEIYKPITRQRGYFIRGKFDQFQRNIPYSAVVSAFADLVHQLLTESESRLVEWRKKLLSALGGNGRVIVDLIPEVELIIGPQPAVPALPAAESQNRLNLVFQNFIQVLTKPEHPLGIFLDDLQWADAATLKLIQLLMTAPDSQYLFLIGAYRDNEVSVTHPLSLTIEEIRQAGAIVNQISLSPLELHDVNQLIVDTLHCSVERAKPLAELILTKTGGNPFFMNEFLKALYDEKLIEFDYSCLMSPVKGKELAVATGKGIDCSDYQQMTPCPEGRVTSKGEWRWSIEQIQEREITDNVVELMVAKIQKLSTKTQQVLQLAAAIANQFELKTLASVLGKSQRETAICLREAVAEGLVFPLNDAYKAIELDMPQLVADQVSVEYKFLHDRIQQAAYCLIPEVVKSAVHWKVGQLLLNHTPANKREQKIFDIVNQLNFGRELSDRQAQRDELAQLNLIAGKKAKASAAYEPALKYLKIGVELLGKDSWQRAYDLTLSLHVEAAEAAYLSRDFEQMEKLADTVLQQAISLLDKVKVYEVKIEAYIAQNQLLEAVKTALSVLKLLGVSFPEKPRQFDVLLGLVGTKLALVGRRIEGLLDLPQMTDPHKLAAMRIMSSVSSATYFAVPELLPLIVFKQVQLSVKHGNAPVSAFAYASHGLILCGVLQNINSGYRFGNLALSLVERFNAKELRARTLMVVNGFIKHWKESLRGTLQSFLAAYSTGLETGDLEFASLSAFIYSCHSYLCGKKLVNVEQEMIAYRGILSQLKQQTALYLHDIYQQAVLNLMGKTENPCCLIGESYNEEKLLPLHLEANDKTAIFTVYFNKLILNYLFQNYTKALKNAELAEKYLDGVLGSPTVNLFYFYDALTRFALFNDVPNHQKKYLLRKLAINQKNLKRWAHYAPMNYLHKFYLVKAERHRVLGQKRQAKDYYTRAIELAKKHKYIHEEALAHELAAKFYLDNGKVTIAQDYIQNAHYYYLRWGANRKAMDLEERYPQWLHKASCSKSTVGTQAFKTSIQTSSSSSGESLDLASVIKASQAISGEIVLDKLLAKLMKILIENAGAQKGFLILASQGQLLIEAEGEVDRDRIQVLQSIPLELIGTYDPKPLLSSAIINYVARTQESVVLNEASGEGQFTNDLYIKEHKPQSILCTPLINQGKLISIVYLENNLTRGAFTPDRIEVLKLLSSQAAIAIENAKLYSELRESESRLAKFLEAVPVGVGILDANGKPYYGNQKAQQLLCKTNPQSVSAEKLSEVYQIYLGGTDRLYPNDRLPLVQALRGESATADDLEIHQGDKIIPLESWGTPIFDAKGKVAYAIVAFQDISERKKAEAERIEFTNQLYELNKANERFVPRQFLQLLNKQSIVDVQVGEAVQQEMSVLFADIRDFTTLSENLTPQDSFKFINSYLSRMEPAIVENNGFIDKYMGDAIMALFSRGADDAVKAGIAMLQQLAEYNRHRANKGYVPIQIGIGINTGSLMLGTVGGYSRMDGTVISDTVNLAARIEQLTKNYGVSLLISHHTFLQLQNANQYAFRIIDRVKVKGKSAAVTVYEVFDGDSSDMRESKLVTKVAFEQALLLYNQQNFREAEQYFQDVLRINPEDKVAQIYLKCCQEQGIRS
jgi:predicted ATPase/class 3 adenylate cyclase/GAF domain-containing protein/tRNA A-37 threonylcarbamoyl transferase component Bud32